MIHAADEQDLRHEVLYAEPYRVVAEPNHPLARLRKLSLAELVDEPWILPPPDSVLRQRLDVLFVSQCGRVPADVVESASILNNQTLVQEARFLAMMLAAVARHYPHFGWAKVLPAALGGIAGPLAVITRQGASEAPAVTAFLEALRTAARSLESARRV